MSLYDQIYTLDRVHLLLARRCWTTAVMARSPRSPQLPPCAAVGLQHCRHPEHRHARGRVVPFVLLASAAPASASPLSTGRLSLGPIWDESRPQPDAIHRIPAMLTALCSAPFFTHWASTRRLSCPC